MGCLKVETVVAVTKNRLRRNPMDAHSNPFEERTYRKVTWRLIPLLLLCYLIAYLDRVNVGFAKLQMMGDLGMSDLVYGLGAGIFFVFLVLAGDTPTTLVPHSTAHALSLCGQKVFSLCS